MKTFVLLILAFITNLMRADAEGSALSLSVSIPSASSGEYALDQRRTPHFHVILLNNSDKPQRIWAPGSEFGERTLRFEFTERTNKFTVKRKNKERVSHELPEIYVLQPHENLVIDVHFADTNAWENFPEAVPGFPLYAMRAVFEIPSDRSSESSKTWSGRIVSAEIKVTIYPWEPRKAE